MVVETFLRNFSSALVEPAAWEPQDEGTLRLMRPALDSVSSQRHRALVGSVLDIDVFTFCMDGPAVYVMVKDSHPTFWRNCYTPAIKLKFEKSRSSSMNRIPLEGKRLSGASPVYYCAL